MPIMARFIMVFSVVLSAGVAGSSRPSRLLKMDRAAAVVEKTKEALSCCYYEFG